MEINGPTGINAYAANNTSAQGKNTQPLQTPGSDPTLESSQAAQPAFSITISSEAREMNENFGQTSGTPAEESLSRPEERAEQGGTQTAPPAQTAAQQTSQILNIVA